MLKSLVILFAGLVSLNSHAVEKFAGTTKCTVKSTQAGALMIDEKIEFDLTMCASGPECVDDVLGPHGNSQSSFKSANNQIELKANVTIGEGCGSFSLEMDGPADYSEAKSSFCNNTGNAKVMLIALGKDTENVLSCLVETLPAQ